MITGQSAIIDAFWRNACRDAGIAPDLPYHASTFADNRIASDADNLVELAQSGQKQGTTHLQLDFSTNHVPMRAPEDYWIILNSAQQPQCVVRLTHVEIMSFNEVAEDHAVCEGEGDLSLDHWRKVHRDYFQHQCSIWGIEWQESLPVVCEKFKLAWPV